MRCGVRPGVVRACVCVPPDAVLHVLSGEGGDARGMESASDMESCKEEGQGRGGERGTSFRYLTQNAQRNV